MCRAAGWRRPVRKPPRPGSSLSQGATRSVLSCSLKPGLDTGQATSGFGRGQGRPGLLLAPPGQVQRGGWGPSRAGSSVSWNSLSPAPSPSHPEGARRPSVSLQINAQLSHGARGVAADDGIAGPAAAPGSFHLGDLRRAKARLQISGHRRKAGGSWGAPCRHVDGFPGRSSSAVWRGVKFTGYVVNRRPELVPFSRFRLRR